MVDASPPDSDQSIPELLRGAQSGRQEALSELLAATYPVVLNFLLKRGTDGALRDMEEDVAVEVLVRVAKHLGACRAETEREYWGWVLTIARNESLRLLRSTYFADSEVLAPGILEELARAEDEHSGGASVLGPMLPFLKAAVAELSTERQSLLGMRFVEGLEYREIGREIGISHAAVKRRVQRLLARLRRDLAQAVRDYEGPNSEAVKSAFDRLNQAR